MRVHLQHEKHGRMPVYSQSEVDRHLKLGWTVMDETVPATVLKPTPITTDEANEVVAPRRGRPPKER